MLLESSEQFERERDRQNRRHDEDHDGSALAAFLVHRIVIRIHQEVTDTGAEVKEESPRQPERDDLDDDVGQKALENFEAQFGSEALAEEIQQERKEKEKCRTADPVQDGYLRRQR